MPKDASPKRKTTAIKDRMTKSQAVAQIAEETGLSKKDVKAVFEANANLMYRHIKPRGAGTYTIPETGVKVRRVKRPARPARKGRNPATGEEITIAAKPASTTVKATVLKTAKEMAQG